MKRTIAGLALLVAVLAAIWLYGRAPTPYARERFVARFHEDRREEFVRTTVEIDRARARGDPAPELERLQAAQEVALGAVRRLEVRGWDVLLVPAGAPPPDPAGFLVVDRVDPTVRGDPRPLLGSIEVWIAPRGLLARLMRSAGLSP
jgi:hypothetical protein